MTRTLYQAAIAAVTGALLATLVVVLSVSRATAATDGSADPINNAPTVEHVVAAEGTRARGFKAYVDDSTSAVYPRLGRMLYRCNLANGPGTDQALECRDGWRGFYAGLVTIRNSADRPDYWPFPDPAPGA